MIAITHVYETVFLLRDWESDRLRRARTEQARLQTELECLGREVDPHFLFNSLNALAHLVDQRSDAAPWFIRTLSATYQYVLECRGRPLVPLADELEALERHRALADVRYARSVCLDVDVQPEDARRLLLPPCRSPELFQNALKHNTVVADAPLHIRRSRRRHHAGRRQRSAARPVGSTLDRDWSPQPRASASGSRPGQPAVWGIEGGRFVVRLPLVRTSEDRLPPG